MSDHADLIRRVRAKPRGQSEQLTEPTKPQALVRAEVSLGFAPLPLPARLYGGVADGGFDPSHRLLPLMGKGRTAVSAHLVERTRSQADPVPHRPHGVLPILDWGCATYAAADCLHPPAPALPSEPNAVEDNWSNTWFQDAPSLADRLTARPDGGGWREEEVACSPRTPKASNHGRTSPGASQHGR